LLENRKVKPKEKIVYYWWEVYESGKRVAYDFVYLIVYEECIETPQPENID